MASSSQQLQDLALVDESELDEILAEMPGEKATLVTIQSSEGFSDDEDTEADSSIVKATKQMAFGDKREKVVTDVEKDPLQDSDDEENEEKSSQEEENEEKSSQEEENVPTKSEGEGKDKGTKTKEKRTSTGRPTNEASSSYIKNPVARMQACTKNIKVVLEKGKRYIERTGSKLYVHYEYTTGTGKKVSGILGEEFVDENGRGGPPPSQVIQDAVEAAMSRNSQTPTSSSSRMPTGGEGSQASYTSPQAKATAPRKRQSCEICRKDSVTNKAGEIQGGILKCATKGCSGFSHTYCLGLGMVEAELGVEDGGTSRTWSCPKHRE